MIENKMMNTKEVAALLGMKPQTLRTWTSQKKISFTKLGSLVRFTPEQVKELILSFRAFLTLKRANLVP